VDKEDKAALEDILDIAGVPELVESAEVAGVAESTGTCTGKVGAEACTALIFANT